MTALELYNKYRLPPQLIEHHLRVAAISQYITQHLNPHSECDSAVVISTCLIHDLGNLAKIKVEQEENWMQPHGLTGWQDIKADFIAKYGADDHQATLNILKAENFSSAVISLFEQMPLQATAAIATGNLGLLICKHADNRTNPDGIVTIDQRLDYLQQRYEKYRVPETYAAAGTAMRSVQSTLQSHVSFDLNLLSDSFLAPQIESLKNYSL